MTRITKIYAHELNEGDRFRLTQHPFSVIYTVDNKSIYNLVACGYRPKDDQLHYISLELCEIVYKMEDEHEN